MSPRSGRNRECLLQGSDELPSLRSRSESSDGGPGLLGPDVCGTDRSAARTRLAIYSICGGRIGCAFFPQMDIDLEFHSIVQRVIDDVMVDARLFFDDQKLC